MTILDDGALIAIVRYRRDADLAPVLDVLQEAGVPIVEITLDTPGALRAIAAASRRGIRMGAGTVVDADGVRTSAAAGARFVVSPAVVEEVVVTALELGLEPIPGVMSPTELLRARELGARTVKIFPAAPLGGPAYIRALRGPFPDVPLVPTGGIEIVDIGAYLAAGAAAVGVGASLVGKEPPVTNEALDGLRRRAAAAAEAARAP